MLAAIIASLDEEVGKDYLPVGEDDYPGEIFASYYIRNDLVSLSNAKDYSNVSKMINTSEGYASDFNMKANAYLMLFSDNPDKISKLLAWLNSGTSGISTQNVTVAESSAENQTAPGEVIPRVLTEPPGSEYQVDLYIGDQYVGTQWRIAPEA